MKRKTLRKNIKSIPQNPMTGTLGAGIAIARVACEDLRIFQEIERSHRDDYHLFLLVEKGTITMEIDFRKHKIKPSTIIYIQPNQVHRMIAGENVTISVWIIDNESLNPEYHRWLEDMAAKPLTLQSEKLSLVSDAITLCIKFFEKQQEKLYHSILKDGCNALVALTASQYLERSKPSDRLSRYNVVTRDFKLALEHDFITLKSPAGYARKLNLSTTYLNECVKNITGLSVSNHIQQRIILEAKRLLFHTDKSAKEIASALGYEDAAYFSRLFTKVAGMSALTFRNKNRE